MKRTCTQGTIKTNQCENELLIGSIVPRKLCLLSINLLDQLTCYIVTAAPMSNVYHQLGFFKFYSLGVLKVLLKGFYVSVPPLFVICFLSFSTLFERLPFHLPTSTPVRRANETLFLISDRASQSSDTFPSSRRIQINGA